MESKPLDHDTATPPAKHWAASKTIWINAIAGGLATLEANTHLLQPLLPVNVYAILAVGLPVINMVLRAVTTQPITTSVSGQ